MLIVDLLGLFCLAGMASDHERSVAQDLELDSFLHRERLPDEMVAGIVCSFFFFQAEDGIRDYKVTGVQTCALPISDGMATVFVSTTWPCHVSLVTGVSPRTHGVVSNHILNRATTRVEDFTGDPIYDAADLVRAPTFYDRAHRSEEHTSELQSPCNLVCRLLLEKKKKKDRYSNRYDS